MAHWRDHLDSTLLGAYSLYDDATENDFFTIDGFITKACEESHNFGKAGIKKVLVAYTSLDQKKPMKINVINGNAISVAAKSQNPQKWINAPVTFFVDKKVSTKDGIVAALRVKPRIVQEVDYTIQTDKLRCCKTMEELITAWSEVGCIALESIKNEMKTKLKPQENELSKD